MLCYELFVHQELIVWWEGQNIVLLTVQHSNCLSKEGVTASAGSGSYASVPSSTWHQ